MSPSDDAGVLLSDWPFVLAGIAVSVLLVPLFVYLVLVVDPAVLAGVSMLWTSVVALLPGFLMGGIGLWISARG